MVARLSAVVLAASALAVATPWGSSGTTTTVTVTAPASTATEPASECSTGGLQCCNSVQPASSNAVTSLLGLLGIVLTDLDIDVGITCSPISVIGTGSSGCTAHPVCCNNNNFNGLIALGCIPVNISL